MKYNYLADLQEGIPYRKSIRKHVGSVTATILIQQLDFHFVAYPDGFYKFLSPVAHHPDYREGDSWVEELGFSEKEFRCAFDHIGIRHTSKTAYSQASNPFINESGEEKFYCSYHDKQNSLTWYFRNHDKVDALIEELIKLVPQKERKRPSSLDSRVTAQRESTVTAQREFTVDDLWEPRNLPLGSYITAQRSSTFIYKENTKNTNKEEEEDSPTPQETVVVESALEQTLLLPDPSRIITQSSITVIPDSVLEQNSDGQKTAKIAKYQDLHNKEIKLPTPELRDWANLEMGQYVRCYRKSGFILTGGVSDISNDFMIFVAQQNCKKGQEATTGLGLNVISKCESDPLSWQKLALWVIEWQKFLKTGNSAGIVETISRESELNRILNAIE